MSLARIRSAEDDAPAKLLSNAEVGLNGDRSASDARDRALLALRVVIRVDDIDHSWVVACEALEETNRGVLPMSPKTASQLPGADWQALVRKNGTREFAAAFAASAILDTSVLMKTSLEVNYGNHNQG